MKYLIITLTFLCFSQNNATAQGVRLQSGFHISTGISGIKKVPGYEYSNGSIQDPTKMNNRFSNFVEAGIDTKLSWNKFNIEFGLALKQATFDIENLYYTLDGYAGPIYLDETYRINYLEVPISFGYQLPLNTNQTVFCNLSAGTSVGGSLIFWEEISFSTAGYAVEKYYEKTFRFSSFSFGKIQFVIDESAFKKFRGSIFMGPKFEFSNSIFPYTYLNDLGYKHPWNLNFQIGLLL